MSAALLLALVPVCCGSGAQAAEGYFPIDLPMPVPAGEAPVIGRAHPPAAIAIDVNAPGPAAMVLHVDAPPADPAETAITGTDPVEKDPAEKDPAEKHPAESDTA
ncbi:MAG: hypothetical protein ACKOZX_03300, partial [Gammaproteobacteria bacterium]